MRLWVFLTCLLLAGCAAPDTRPIVSPPNTIAPVVCYKPQAEVVMTLDYAPEKGGGWHTRIELVPNSTGYWMYFLRNWNPPPPGEKRGIEYTTRKSLFSAYGDLVRRATAQEIAAADGAPPIGKGPQHFTFAVRQPDGRYAVVRFNSPEDGNPGRLAQTYRVLCAIAQLAADNGVNSFVNAQYNRQYAMLVFLAQSILDNPPAAAQKKPAPAPGK